MNSISVRSGDRSVQGILRKPYARILIPEHDGTYSADILEFPGCHAEGDTASEAIENLEKAAVSWIEAALEQGQEIPLPMTVYGYSGKINLRLPKSVHKQAARFAQRDDVSLNQFFISAIAARVGAEEFYEHLVKRFLTQSRSAISVTNVVTNVMQNSLFVAISLEALDIRRQEGTESIMQDVRALTVETTKASPNG